PDPILKPLQPRLAAPRFVVVNFWSWFLRVFKLLAVSWILSPGGIAKAQDALRSAISLQPVIAPAQPLPVDLRPEHPHLGPVQLTYGLYAGLELNDNITTSETDPQSDLLLEGGLNVGLFWPATLQSALQFGLSVGYVHYVRNPQFDHVQVAPNSALTWSIGF